MSLGGQRRRGLVEARRYAARQIPCYTIIHGGTWPSDAIARLAPYAECVRLDGIIYRGTGYVSKREVVV